MSPSELSEIDFVGLIGGPLSAVIGAQVMSALATVDFILKVGCYAPKDNANADPTTSSAAPVELKYVSFNYQKNVGSDATTGTTAGVKGTSTQNRVLTVPFLAILPIPNLEIEDVTISFNAQIGGFNVAANNLKTQTTATGGYASPAVKMDASFSRQTDSTSDSSDGRDFSLTVVVRARQAPMPAGLARVLDMLETAMKDTTA